MMMNTSGFEAEKHSGSKTSSPYPIKQQKQCVFFFPPRDHLLIQPKAFQIRFWFVFLTVKLLCEENNMKES